MLSIYSWGQAGPVRLQGSGGIVTEINVSGTYYEVHTFTTTSSSTFTPPSGASSLDYLVVAGGGGGGSINIATYCGAGGGGGGMRTGSIASAIYSITVGDGGIAGTSVANGGNGQNSSIGSSIIAIGGGGAGSYISSNGNGLLGGSGGGSRGNGATGGSGTSGQGNVGGNCSANSAGSGGGGAGAAAANVTTTGVATAGGNGLQSSINGTNTYYAGGGGGGGNSIANNKAGGLGGGGAAGQAGTANTGGGGGGQAFSSTIGSGFSGGSGIVILRYKAPTMTIATQPSNSISSGQNFAQPTVVRILNGDGNPISGITVTAAIEVGTGTLTNITATTDDNGDATFTNLQITGSPGFFTLNFTVPGASQKVVSNTITLSISPYLLDIFRSRQSGNWSNSNTWDQQWSDGSWTNTANIPAAINSPLVENTATYQTNNQISSHPVTLPTGIQEGDLLMMIFRAGSIQTASAPSGWTELGNRSNNGVTYIWYKTAGTSEGTSVTVTTGGNIRAAAVTYRISGWVGTPELAFAGTNVNDPPSFTPSWGFTSPSLFLAVMTNRRSDSNVTGAPTNYTGLVTISQNSNNGTSRSRVSSSQRNLTATSNDPGAFTTTGTIDNPHSATIVIKGAKSITTIQNSHIVIVTSNQTADDVVTESGGTLTINNGFNLDISAGSTLTVGGRIKLLPTGFVNGAGDFILNSGANIEIGSTTGITSTTASGNIQNIGTTRSFSSGANYTYNGTSAQATGNGLTGANNLIINNAAGVTLSAPTSVSGTLNLSSGILTTTSNLLSVTNTATSAISDGSSTSFINGPVKWSIGTGAYLFPVGKSTGNYLPFTLTTSTVSSPVITVEAFKADVGAATAFDATLASISHTEYWQTTLNSGILEGSVSVDRGTSISPLNVIAGSASQAGSFASLDGSSGSTGVSNSTMIGSNRYFVLAEKKKATLSIAATNQAAEPNSNGLFTITTSSQFATATTVNIIVSGTASNGTDYTTIASSVTFPANQSAMTIPVSVIDDSSFEGTETVIITLNTGTSYGIGSPSEATVTITDNDSPPVPSVSLTIDKPTIAENGGTAIVTAILSNIYNQSVVVYIDYSGTASHPNDYADPTSYSITIPAGSLSGTITISSKDDCVVEGDETVVVDIGSVTNGTENGNQQVTTTIVDDDTYPTITLSADNLSIPENGGVSIVKATLSNPFCQDVIISLGYSGTAAHPNDYPNPSSYSITVVAGSLIGTTTIASSNDYLVEGDETVVVGVQSTNIAGISASVNPVTITIVDDDSYSFTVTPTSGLVTTEAGGAATFTVVLNALTYNDVTIQLTSSDLTEGTVFPSSLTFTNGNFFTPQTVTVTGVDDALVDGNISYTIITSSAASDNNDFKGIDPSDVSVTNIDNDGSSDNFWFMADAGINGNVTSWVDQSGNNINATNSGSVSKVDNSINFNPSLSFSSVNRQFVISGTKNIQSLIVVNKTPDTNSDLAGLIGADGDKGIRLSNNVNELTPVVTPYLSWKGNNNTDDWVNTTNIGTGRINGINDASLLHSSKWHIANITRYQALSGTYYIGGYYSGRPYSGYIAEVMAFDNDPSDGAIESYLALKYGITLGNTSSFVNYVSPSGIVIWTGSTTYQNDIAGLGKESIYMLDQKVSSSVNTPSGTSARVVMATDNDFTSSNQSGRTSLSNGQYLIWGHNNLGVNSLTTDGSFDRVARIWKVENTGVSSTVNFQIDLTGFPNPSELSLILDDDANLSNGGTTVISFANSSGNLFSTSISFPIGTSYFTIGKCKSMSVSVNSPVICAGSGAATITAFPSPAGTYTYSWTVPGGATNPGNVNSFNATIQGTYTVEITNVGGCIASGYGNLTVNPKPSLTLHNPGAVCFPSTIDLTTAAVTSGSTSGLTYSYWTDSGASTALNSPSSISISGTYYIKGMIAATNCFDIQPVVVTINPLPSKYTVTGSGTYCLAGTVGLSGSEAGVNYQLYNGATKVGSPVSGTGDAISFGNQQAGTYTVVATISNGDCLAQMTGSAVVTIGDNEKPAITKCLPNGETDCVKNLPVAITTIQDFIDAGGEVTDNCTAPMTVSYNDVITPGSSCEVRRTYTITDASTNTATCTQVFTITDTEAPVINSITDLIVSPSSNSCGANLIINVPTDVTENCGYVVAGAHFEYTIAGTTKTGTGTITDTFPEGTTLITWTIADLCGHVSLPKTQKVQVVFNLTSISYDNGSSATGLGSGVEPMQTSTHEYFVDNKVPESGYTYSWGLFEADGVTVVNSSLYTKTSVNAAHIKISFTTIPTGNYILSVIKSKTGITCKKQVTLPIAVQSNSSFDVVLDNLGNQCQAPSGNLTTISWNVTFPNVITEPFVFSYSIKLGGTVVASGNVANITYAGAIPMLGLSTGAQTSKSANSRAIVIYYSLYGVSGDDLARTVEIEINATDAYQVSEPNRTNNIDDLMINQVPVITFE